MRQIRWSQTLLWVLAALAMIEAGCRSSAPLDYQAKDPMVANSGDVYSNRD